MADYEWLSIGGPEPSLRGFLQGWSAGRGWTAAETATRVLWVRDWHLRIEGRPRGGHGNELLVRGDTSDAWLAALAAEPGAANLRARRRVAAASFGFEFELFARPEAEEVRALFQALPEGVTLRDYETADTSDPQAVGIELRGSLHDYSFRGRGVAVGDVAGLLLLHERSRRHERIHTTDVTLELAT